MKTSFLIPKTGVLVIDPDTNTPLPPEGAEVRLSTYWQRRIADGDVTPGQPAAPVKTKGAK